MSETDTNDRRAEIAILRLQLFKPSETFISSQAESYKRYQPIYVGRKLFGPRPQKADVVIPEPGTFAALRMVVLRDPAYFVKLLKDRRPTLLHAHFAIDATFALPLARHLKIPLVTTLHGFDVTTRDSVFLRSMKPSLINAVLWRRQLQRQASLFVCVSEFIRAQALQQGYPEKKLVTLPIGINVRRFQPAEQPGRKVIVHVARLVEKKGTVYLLRAFSIIASEFPEIRLVIIGGGPLEQSLKNEAISLGIAGRVDFLGVQPHAETLRWVKEAVAVIVPSITASSGDSEGLPTVLFEAGALGVPVVASLTSGIPEAVRDGETGFLLPERDIEGLAQRMSLLIGSPDLRDRLGCAARTMMEASFDIENQTAILEDYYDRLIQDRVP